MDQQTKVSLRPQDAVALICIEGDLTSLSDDALDSAYREAIEKGHQKILLTFREEDHLNSAGIGMLITLVTESQKRDVAVRIAHPSAHFRTVFNIVGLTQYVEVRESVEEGLRDF